MKKTYVTPAINLVEVKIEKGFAASEGYSIEQFQYDITGKDDPGYDADNTAW